MATILLFSVFYLNRKDSFQKLNELIKMQENAGKSEMEQDKDFEDFVKKILYEKYKFNKNFYN